MLTREQGFHLAKAIAKGAWNCVPEILAKIPAAAIAGKVLTEVKKAYEEEKAAKGQEEAIAPVIERCGGKAEFEKKLRQELREERDSKNPAYINCAIFQTNAGDCLSKSEQKKLEDTLKGEIKAETAELASFADAFREDYFADDYAACDNPIEIGESYIAFNFDDTSDHPYDEEDLKMIMDSMNKMIGREAFCEYEGAGTDDSVGY